MTKVIRDNKLSLVDGRKFVTDIALRLYEKLDTPTSLMCYIVLNEGDFEQLYDLSVDPNNYLDVDRFQKDYQAVSYIKKCILNDSDSRAKMALEKFLEAEAECLTTNLLLRERLRKNKVFSGIVHTAARIVSGILGAVPDLATHSFRFGPGATSAVNGLKVNIPGKFNKGNLQCTRGAIPLVERMFLHNPLLYAAKTGLYVEGPASVARPTFDMVNYNSLTFVPKNGKVDRCICIEPDMNVPLQLMAGRYIRHRLLLAGVDLRKQQSVNARFAKIGSQDGSYSTIDLSSASDSIAIAIVAELLPFGWFDLLSNLRSPFTRYKDCNGTDTYIENEKFSSMGNGFTFELETLLFFALAKACTIHLECNEPVNVYGDDIIVPTRVAPVLLDVLRMAGFTPNEEKTFVTGPFRESCGQDFFLGIAVRPIFLKEIPKHEVDKFKIANSIRNIAHHSYGGIGLCDRRFRPLWERIVNSIPRHWRLFGPSELGDTVINACYGEKNFATNLYGITYLRGAVFRPRRGSLSSHDDGVQRASGIYGCSQTYPLRGRGQYGVIKYTVRNWDAYDFRWC